MTHHTNIFPRTRCRVLAFLVLVAVPSCSSFLSQRIPGPEPWFTTRLASSESDNDEPSSAQPLWEPNQDGVLFFNGYGDPKNGGRSNGKHNENNNGARKRPNKANLYPMDELEKILNLHQSLSSNNVFSPPPSSQRDDLSSSNTFGVGVPDGLHEMVLQTLREDEESSQTKNNKQEIINTDYPVSDELKERVQNVRAIASDVDGTLLNKEHKMHPLTKQAIERAVEAANSQHTQLQYFFPATGKSRAGALNCMGPEIASILSKVPGVFLQGLYCVNATGHVVFEQKLGPEMEELLAQAEELAHEWGLTVLAFDGSVLHSTRHSLERNPHHIRDLQTVWGEPERPTILSTTKGYQRRFHKWMVMADSGQEIEAFRPHLQALAEPYQATLTVAVPTMLELLPADSCKAVGVRQLCKHLGIDMSAQLLALGDGENDIELLQQASVGVAMGNAVSILKQAEGVDIVMKESNDEGGAGLAIELFGMGKYLDDEER